MEGSPIRWGIIAPGNIANRFAEAFAAVEDGILQGVASRDTARGQQFADKHGIPKVFSDYDTLISSNEIDAIYISSPHRFHFNAVKACLLADKPVLCEKPLTVTAKQAQELIELSEQRGVFLMEALWTRLLPAWQQVRSWLDDKLIGDVVTIESTFGFRFPKDPTNRLYNRELAGGALLDTGIYCLAMSDFVMQKEPTVVHSAIQKSQTEVDKRTSVLLEYGSASSSFTCALESELANTMTIYGTNGSITIDACFWDAQQARLRIAEQEETVAHLAYRQNGFEYQIEEAQRCIKAGVIQSSAVSHAFTLRTAKLMDEILENGGVHYPFTPR